MSESLITKYRPSTFDAMVGHENVLSMLQKALERDTRPHGFLFSGPSGVGKTTAARIVANQLDAETFETDAAKNSSVEAMRALVEMAGYAPLSGKRRLIIIDECQRASRAAFDALLKIMEEPPPFLFIALCTTEIDKVPETILTRCYPVKFNPVPQLDLELLLIDVCEAEGWNLSPDVIQLVGQAAEGSPRQALSFLQGASSAATREEAQAIINYMGESDPLLELVKLLLSGNKSWPRVRELLSQAELQDFEVGSTSLARYITNAMVRSEDPKAAMLAWSLLDALTFPSHSFDKKALFFAAIGRMLWSNGGNPT